MPDTFTFEEAAAPESFSFEDAQQPETFSFEDALKPIETPKRDALLAEQAKVRKEAGPLNLASDIATGAERFTESVSPHGLLNQPTRIYGALTGQNIPEGSDQLIPETHLTGPEWWKGALNVANKVAVGLLDPDTLITLPAAGAGAVGKLLFGLPILQHFPEQVKNAVDVWRDPKSTPAQRVEAIGDPIVSSAFAFLIAHAPEAKPLGIKPSVEGENVLRRTISEVPPEPPLNISAERILGTEVKPPPAAPEAAAPPPQPAVSAPQLAAMEPQPPVPPKVPAAAQEAAARQPGATVRFYNGQEEGSGGGSTWTTNPQRARSYGVNVSFVDVPADLAAKFAADRQAGGSGTGGDVTLPKEWMDKAQPVAEPVAQTVHDLDATEETPNAVQIESPGPGVLRPKQPEVELQGVGASNAINEKAPGASEAAPAVPAKAPRPQAAVTFTPVLQTADGALYQASSHAAALKEATADFQAGKISIDDFLQITEASANDAQHKFLTSDGRVLTRAEAGKESGLGGNLQSEDLKAAGMLKHLETPAAPAAESATVPAAAETVKPVAETKAPVAAAGELVAIQNELKREAAATRAQMEATAEPEPQKAEHIPMGGSTPAATPNFPTIGEQIPARLGAASPAPVAPTPQAGSTAGIIDNLRGLFSREGIGRMATAVKGTLGTIAGKTFPKTTLANRAAGELGARYISSRIFAPFAGKLFARDVLTGTGVDPVKFGAALSEDNLRSVRDSNLERAKDPELSDAERKKYQERADNAFTFIGEKKPFASEAQYQQFLADPNVKEAIRRHIDNWNAVIEPQYREAMQIDPELELPTRGKQTGARVNLAAIREGEPVPPGTVSSAPRGGILNTLRKKSPFGRQATGAGESYAATYNDIIANTFHKQTEIANKNAFDEGLVQHGLAVIDDPGQKVKIGGEDTVAFPLKRKTLITPQGAFSQNKSIYVKKSLAREYRNAANLDDNPYRDQFVQHVNNVLNQSALAGLTDATVHVTNLSTALMQVPVSKLNLLSDSLLSLAGRLDVLNTARLAAKKAVPEAARAALQRSKLLKSVTPDRIVRSIEDAFWKNQTQLADLAQIGALKGQHPTGRIPVLREMSQVIQWYDRTTRMVLDDAYQDLAARGIVQNSETARREFVNQVGQYNKRAQGVMVRLARDTGFGPFVTAGRNFNVQGVRAAALNPGVAATSPANAALLRVNAASKWMGTFAFVGLANYLITGKMLGRHGTPIGSIDTGENDKQGRQKSFSVVNLTGQGRALRVTGLRGAIEAKQKGLNNASAVDSSGRDIANSWISPFAGPAVKAGFVGVSGFPPAINVGRASPVAAPGESQVAENLKQVAKDVNPVVAGAFKSTEPGKTWEEAVKTQLPRFTMQTKQTEKMMEDYPAIVRRAQANAFMEDVIHRSRYIENDDQRSKYIRDSLEKLDTADRPHAILTLRFRKIRY